MHFEGLAVGGKFWKCLGMLLDGLACHFRELNAADTGRRPGKVFVDEGLTQPDGFKNLRPAVGLDRRDAHL